MILQETLFSQEELGGIPLEDVFEAYFECRKKKRNTCNALAFESDYERGVWNCGGKSMPAHTALRVPSLSLSTNP